MAKEETKKTTQPEKLNIWQKIAKVRNEASVKKTGVNEYGGYHYFELPAIYGEAKKLFDKYGLATIFLMERVAENRYLGKLTIINADNPDEQITLTLETEGLEQTYIIDKKTGKPKKAMTPPQETGAVMTYLRKYLYSDLMMLDDGATDPDRWAAPDEIVKHAPKPQQPQTQKKQSSEEQKIRSALIRSCSNLFTAMKIAPVEAHELIQKWSKGKFKSIKEMPVSDLQRFEEYLTGLKETKDLAAKVKEEMGNETIEPPADDMPEIEKEQEGGNDVPF